MGSWWASLDVWHVQLDAFKCRRQVVVVVEDNRRQSSKLHWLHCRCAQGRPFAIHGGYRPGSIQYWRASATRRSLTAWGPWRPSLATASWMLLSWISLQTTKLDVLVLIWGHRCIPSSCRLEVSSIDWHHHRVCPALHQVPCWVAQLFGQISDT